jgi:hypothetical protein
MADAHILTRVERKAVFDEICKFGAIREFEPLLVLVYPSPVLGLDLFLVRRAELIRLVALI